MTIKAEFPFDEDDLECHDNKKEISPAECRKILGMISDFSADFMGFDVRF